MNTNFMQIIRTYAGPSRVILTLWLMMSLVVASVPTLAVATTSGTDLSVPALPSVPSLSVPELSTSDLTVPPLPQPPALTVPGLPTVPTLTSSSSSHTATFCRITASAETVTQGGSVTLTWTTQGFSTVTINGQSVSDLNGSRIFTDIQENTTYTLIARTADGKSSCTATVTVTCLPPVIEPLPTCVLNSNKTTLVRGESATLTWSSQNGDRASLSPAIGTVALSGARPVSPTVTTTYTLRVEQDYNHSVRTVDCPVTITVTEPPVTPVPTCTLTPTTRTISSGGTATLTWSTTNANDVRLSSFGTVATSGSRVTPALSTSTTYVLTARNTVTSQEVTCQSVITVTPPPPVPLPTCVLSPVTQTLQTGATTTLTWSTTNANDVRLSSFGTVATSGSRVTPALSTSTTYVLTARNTVTSQEVTCQSVIIVTPPPPVPVPQCVSFAASPLSITRGATSTLTWNTIRGTRVVINNGIGEVAATGSVSVAPLQSTTYTLTVFGTAEQAPVTCQTAVTVTVPPPPSTSPRCELFTATPNQVPNGGGTTTLAWTVRDATAVSISGGVGVVGLTGSQEVFVGQNTTFVLTASDDDETVTCAAPVTVAPPPPPSDPFTCANAVSFTANPNAIRRGESSTLTWSTTNVDSLSISGGVSATSLSGSTTVSPSDSTTYILTANRGSQSIQCPVTVSVSTGGGGGGSASPRCELTVSDRSITRGESVVLRWESSFATDVYIRDNFGDTISDSRRVLAADKEDYFDGRATVRPTRDTTYTMTVERGSRERECTVRVEVEDTLVVLETRDQQPLLTSISLTDVPHTGFAAGPFLTIMFYVLIGAWAVLIAYLLVIRRDSVAGYEMAVAATAPVATQTVREHIVTDSAAPIIPDGLFVARVQPPVIPPLSHLKDTPDNLPTGTPVIGYAAAVAAETNQATQVETTDVLVAPAQQATDAVVTALEDHAHNQRTLLSSDALRYFISTTPDPSVRITLLDTIIADAKTQYPLEDGWMVLNEARMRNVCTACLSQPVASSVAPHIPATIPAGSGSLAEAIVTGNVIAAYQMIGHRPMFALADAASDLDSVVRLRKGEAVIVSDMLQSETAKLSDEQLTKMIAALTGAIDGTYTDEASAVKMAIMKAVKEAA